MVAPWLTGFVLERSGHFSWAFVIMTGVALSGAASWVFIVGAVGVMAQMLEETAPKEITPNMSAAMQAFVLLNSASPMKSPANASPPPVNVLRTI